MEITRYRDVEVEYKPGPENREIIQSEKWRKHFGELIIYGCEYFSNISPVDIYVADAHNFGNSGRICFP